jgi:hypothetical protein
LFVEIDWRSAQHAAGNVSGASVGFASHLLVSGQTGGGATNLKTLTDHPIFATSPLNVPNSEARVSDESVFESVVRRYKDAGGLHRGNTAPAKPRSLSFSS